MKVERVLALPEGLEMTTIEGIVNLFIKIKDTDEL